MGKFLMIADDFTGAGDAGVQMTKNGIEAHIVFNTDNINPEKSYVIDSESRNIPREEAYKKVRKIFREMETYSFDHYYKKIDSTLRGNLKEELVAAEEVLKPDLIVFNPGNPDSNRTVVDGTLMFNGIRICETEIMRDPLSLVKEDNLKKLLETEMQDAVQYFSLNQVRSGQLELDGSKYITFDVLENRDLEAVVRFVLNSGKKVLWVGSAGMANALFKTLQPKYPVLSLVGSISDTSRSQVRAAEESGAQIVKMDVAELLKGAKLEAVAKEAILGLKIGNDVVVVSAKEHEDYLHAVDVGSRMGMKRGDVAKYTQEKIGELSKMILKEAKVCGVFLTGGDTAISVTEKNHAHGATIKDEVLPIIALVELDGGDYPGLPCIVKGGSIGDKDALVGSIKYFKER
ncbi:MAG: four-carbon acid sugar kinase family protein [Hespellia sp.]|nr:four-carbon acid sugar kinase family protein [Hespellia sp.]